MLRRRGPIWPKSTLPTSNPRRATLRGRYGLRSRRGSRCWLPLLVREIPIRASAAVEEAANIAIWREAVPDTVSVISWAIVRTRYPESTGTDA